MLKIRLFGGEKLIYTANLLENILKSSETKNSISINLINTRKDYQIEFSSDLTDFTQNIYKIDDFGEELISNDFNFIILNTINKKSEEMLDKNEEIERTYFLVDNDEKSIYSYLKNKENLENIITFGLNKESLITASSLRDDSVMFCIQKPIITYSGKIIEEQEFIVKFKHIQENLYPLMSAVTASILSDVRIEDLEKICN